MIIGKKTPSLWLNLITGEIYSTSLLLRVVADRL